jgi:Asp/Glu/hydantoin racemase
MASEENRAVRPSAPRIFLIHATPLAIAAINDSFRKLWPEAGLANLLDDSLSPDLQRAGKIDRSLTDRFLKLATYARDAGADGIIFTCSAFGPAINACKEVLPIPVLRPNEAMVGDALAHGDRLALMATFEPALAPITDEIHLYASSLGRRVAVDRVYVPGALEAAQKGDEARHDDLIARAAGGVQDADVICFAQFSMSQTAADMCAAISGRPVLTTPDSAVRRMRQLLADSGE